MMTNEEMYKQYHKLVYSQISTYKYKPKNWNYKESVYDVASEVWTVLFSIPIHGTKRKNPAYISVVSGNAIKSIFKSLNTHSYNSYLNVDDFESDENLVEADTFDDTETKVLVQNILQNALTLDEQIVVAAHFGLNPLGKRHSIKAISKLIFQNREQTQRILDRAVLKIRNYIKTS